MGYSSKAFLEMRDYESDYESGSHSENIEWGIAPKLVPFVPEAPKPELLKLMVSCRHGEMTKIWETDAARFKRELSLFMRRQEFILHKKFKVRDDSLIYKVYINGEFAYSL